MQCEASPIRFDSAAVVLPANPVERLHAASTSPICDVPYDVLVLIFKHATAVAEPSFTYIIDPNYHWKVPEADLRKAYTEARAVLSIAHTCRYWRQTALGTPLLWTRIDSRHRECRAMYMDASKELPVSLCLDTDVDSSLATSLYTVPAERLRRLDLNLDSLESDTHVEFLTTRTAPNLECLTMLASDENYDWSEMRCPPARVQLLSGQADALKALALQHLGSWLPSNSFPNLTHLHMSFSVTSGVCTLDILAVLANAPNLVFVFIDRLLRIGDEPVVPGAIALSRLRSLALVDCRYVSAISFLKQLALPEHCVVRLSYLSIYTGPEQEGEPAPLPDAGPLHHATKLDIAASHNEMLLVADSDTSGYWIQAQRDDLRTTWDAWLHELPAMMTLSAITSLHINIDPDHTFWSPVLRHMPAVTELKAFIGETWTGRPLPIDILCAILSEEPVLLPSLRDLYVQGTNNNETVTTLTSESAAFVDMVVYRARLRRLRVQPDCDSHYGARTATHDPFGSRLAELAANVDDFELLGFGNPLCKYEMRDVWHVDGADRYWKPREEDRACYVLPKMLSYCV